MLCKKGVLKTLQCPQENTCVGVSLQAFRFAILLIRDTNTYVFLRTLRNFKEHHFEKHLRTTASYFMNKNRNNSSKKIKINGNICRSSRPEVFCKKVFLKISQNSQENTCTRASFLIKLQAPACSFIKKEALAQEFSCGFCEISKNTFFHRAHLVAASLYGFSIS